MNYSKITIGQKNNAIIASFLENRTEYSMIIMMTSNLSCRKLLCVSDCSGKPAKAGAVGAQGAAERPEEATVRDHEPHGQRLRTCSGKRDGAAKRAGTP